MATSPEAAPAPDIAAPAPPTAASPGVSPPPAPATPPAPPAGETGQSAPPPTTATPAPPISIPATPPPQVAPPPPVPATAVPSPPQDSPPTSANPAPPPPPPPPAPDSSSSGSSSSQPPPPTDVTAPPQPPTANPRPTPSSAALSPPPPTHSPRSSSHSAPHSSSKSRGGSHSDVNIPLVVGTIAGVGLFFILMAVVFLFCKRKKKNPRDPIHYYADNSGLKGPPKVAGGDYYAVGGPPPPPSWNGMPPFSSDHVLKVPLPPGSGWRPPPPLSGPMMSSGEMSSAFSGPHGPPLPPPSPNIALGFNKSTFSYDELAAATGGFSQANLLGQGGFGYVHKGMLPDGKDIAVKSLKSGSGQGEREFQAEVEIISRVHHRHLVSLVGYCIAGGQRMLVYEFVPNKTLEHHLHGKNCPTMDFPTRMRIALGSAKGLAYLHEDCHPRIIHRDIKAANILLDHRCEAMVADFGLAKLSEDTNTHVSTRVMGTFGYLAPEYASSGKLTEKSDVFSFGVMLLELITGRRPIDTTNTLMEDSLVDWARPLMARALEDGNCDDLADPRLEGNYNPTEMVRLVACAAASVRHSARRRPKMSQIVRALEGDSSLEDLNEVANAGLSHGFSSGASISSSGDFDSSSYSSNMKNFRKIALASQDFGSSEYGATSEYGLNPSASSSSTGNNSQEVSRTTLRKNNY